MQRKRRSRKASAAMLSSLTSLSFDEQLRRVMEISRAELEAEAERRPAPGKTSPCAEPAQTPDADGELCRAPRARKRPRLLAEDMERLAFEADVRRALKRSLDPEQGASDAAPASTSRGISAAEACVGQPRGASLGRRDRQGGQDKGTRPAPAAAGARKAAAGLRRAKSATRPPARGRHKPSPGAPSTERGGAPAEVREAAKGQGAAARGYGSARKCDPTEGRRDAEAARARPSMPNKREPALRKAAPSSGGAPPSLKKGSRDGGRQTLGKWTRRGRRSAVVDTIHFDWEDVQMHGHYVGVARLHGRFFAFLERRKEREILGWFDSSIEAAYAYDETAQQLNIRSRRNFVVAKARDAALPEYARGQHW